MIRVVTLDTFDDKQLVKFCKTLYTAFGVGSEHSGQVELPPGFGEPLDAERLLAEVKGVRAYQDDKVLFITARKLKERQVAGATAPTPGYALYNKDRAIISTVPHKDLVESGYKAIARNALQQVGHLWGLHHCLDPRCSMYPPWTPSFAQGEPSFCTFCRDKSEQKIRLAKS